MPKREEQTLEARHTFSSNALSSPVVGTKRNLVILVDFPNLAHQPETTTDETSKIFNQIGYSDHNARGSVRDYFKEVSYGQLDFVSYVAEWVTVSQNFEYYGKNDPNTGFDSKPREMVAEALQILNNRGFDFTIADYNRDGYIDGLTVLHSGGGEEYPGNDPNFIWSHKWQLSSPVIYDGVAIQEYHTVPECMGMTSDPSTHSITRIGVICHDAAHLLGLPDLYDEDYSSAGVGNFCLMGTGLWNGAEGYFATQPAHPSAWCKIKLGWLTPQVITENKSYPLPQIETNEVVYKLEVPGNSSEYFLIENRQPEGFDESLPGTKQGILIWHIDESRPDNTDENHLLVDLEEASEKQDLQLNLSRGSNDDYFRDDTLTSFGLHSTPSSQTYQDQT